jgi:Cu+-exporting ATPase
LSVQSTHPHSRRIAEILAAAQPQYGSARAGAVRDFAEIPGRGLEGTIDEHHIRLGSREWLESCGTEIPVLELPSGSVSYLSIDGRVRGALVFANTLRPQTEQLFTELASQYELALLSGDNEKERARFSCLFGGDARLHFHQSPADKLAFIRHLKEGGKTVMMVGDGLNDAGALKQSDVGVAVVEKIGVFSPASDLILEAGQVPQLRRILDFARSSTRVVRVSFGISAAYNLVGVGIASAGILSPLICAVLMPLSSISVVLFACGATSRAAKRAGIQPAAPVTA